MEFGMKEQKSKIHARIGDEFEQKSGPLISIPSYVYLLSILAGQNKLKSPHAQLNANLRKFDLRELCKKITNVNRELNVLLFIIIRCLLISKPF